MPTITPAALEYLVQLLTRESVAASRDEDFDRADLALHLALIFRGQMKRPAHV